MRSIMSSLLLLCTLVAPAAGQVPEALRAYRPPKREIGGMPLAPVSSGVVGDDFTNPFVITSLPYGDAGSNCTFFNDVQGVCGGAGPDVVYRFTPTQNVTVTISLCDPFTDFDTVLNLYQNSGSTLVTCSDDVCGLQSEISNVTLFAGNTYFIVIDGFAGACGNYRLSITNTQTSCSVSCPPSATAEGEPIRLDGAVDNYNGGCNSALPTWTDVPCSQSPVTVCGNYGTFVTGGQNFRDTDWYRIVANQPTTLLATLDGEINGVVAIVDISGGCNNLLSPGPLTNASPCTPVTCTAIVPAGAYFVFVAPANFSGSPGAQRYTFTVSGSNCVTATKAKTWAGLKALYR